jgi:hypothetical protein
MPLLNPTVSPTLGGVGVLNTDQLQNFVSNVDILWLKEITEQKPDMVRSMFSMTPWDKARDGEMVTFDRVLTKVRSHHSARYRKGIL